jgi:hypothetical protein
MTSDAALTRKLESVRKLTKAANELLDATNSILNRIDALLDEIDGADAGARAVVAARDARLH